MSRFCTLFRILIPALVFPLVVSLFNQDPSPRTSNASRETPGAEKAASVPRQDSELRLGLTREKPSEGKFVELPDGTFMVTYTTKIPGTKIEFTMVPIPGGKFLMGSPDSEEDRNDDEGPQIEVTVEPFWMGKHEITWLEYKAYMRMEQIYGLLHDNQKRKAEKEQIGDVDVITAPSTVHSPDFTYGAGEANEEPAATMSQFAARQYTKWLSVLSDDFYRLPYEAEWEYACRAGTTTAFYFGDDPDDVEENGWYFDNNDNCRSPVGQLPPNPWGLHDMHGNVSEWVLDQHSNDGYARLLGKSVSVVESFNPPAEIHNRVARGGSYRSTPDECRSAARLVSTEKWRSRDPLVPRSPWWYTEEEAEGVGFRIVRPLDQLPRDQMEAFWNVDVAELNRETLLRISEHGKGKLGTIDKQLLEDIDELRKQRQK